MKKFTEWFKSATTQERDKLADAANITIDTIYKLSNGKRRASASLAGAIEVGLTQLDRPPDITRADICEACAECPYAIKCLKKG